MKFVLIFLIINFYLVYATSPFLRYNLENVLKGKPYNCPNPEFYIKMADEEETKHANQDKIILYHGEYYGVWIYQKILKAFQYPDAPEDWLPLRNELLTTDIDKTTLLKMIGHGGTDHLLDYSNIGISVSPNLYSSSWSESAWGIVCIKRSENWNLVTGFSETLIALNYDLYDQLKRKYIPKEQWDKFDRQKGLLLYFIQEKRRLIPKIRNLDFKKEIQSYFPKTFEKFRDAPDLNAIEEPYIRSEGVILQIIMERDLADEITYNSHPFGFYKDDEKYSFYDENNDNYKFGKAWEGDETMPYSQIYKQVKNQKDNEQARLALTNDFRRYPSRVRIKAIAGIMENTQDYEIVKSMIQEMVGFKEKGKKKIDPEKKKKDSAFKKFKKLLKGFY